MKTFCSQRKSRYFLWVSLGALLYSGPASSVGDIKTTPTRSDVRAAFVYSDIAPSDSDASFAFADSDGGSSAFSDRVVALGDLETRVARGVPDAKPATADDCLGAEDCIDQYLWSIYERTRKVDTVKVPERISVTVKKKGKTRTVTKTIFKFVNEDFAWKDPKAAENVGMSVPEYVIGGMDRGFKLRLYRLFRMLDDAGLAPGMTSGFRDDYRQSIASGTKAATDRSYHGGSLRGGYGHGLAADIVSVLGETRAERWISTEALWKWIDAHSKQIGIGRPYLDKDPPHIAPIDGKEYADHRGLTKRAASLGVGGIGKTRLAIEAARRVLEEVTDKTGPASTPIVRNQGLWVAGQIYFVSLASVEKAELVLSTIAQSLELQVTGSELQAEIITYLAQRTLLLVLDNFEHLQDAAGTIAHLLQEAPSVKLLVTSRERLHLREEWLMPVAGLALTEGLLSEAGQLFFRSAQRVQPAFSSYGQEEAIAAICAQVEGMPLALELAASWVRVMPCAEIASQLAQNCHIFTTTLRNVPERHRSLRSLFDQSWRLLSPLEQSALQRVSVFRGGWTLEESAQVADATLPILLGLVDKSLVRTNGQGRFDLHELVRQYAAEQLGASGEVDLIRQRHYAAYLQLFRNADSQLRGPEAAGWFARLEAEQDNLRGALQWALAQAHYADAAWLVVAADWHWVGRGQWYESGWWLARLLPHRAALGADLRLVILIQLLAVARSVEEFQPVDKYIGEIMQLMASGTSKLLDAHVWYFIAIYASDFLRASEAWERSIAAARAASAAPALGPEFCLFTDLEFVLVSNIAGYATYLIEHGEIARAQPLVAESLKLFQARKNQYEIAEGYSTLGLLALVQGDLVQARTHFQAAVDIAAAVNHPGSLGSLQPLLSIVMLYDGDAAGARRLLSESLHLCLELKDKFLLARVCAFLADVELWEGNLDHAEHWLARSLAYYAEPHRVTIEQVGRLFVAARLSTAQQHYDRAATLFGLACQIHSTIHDVIAGPMRALADDALATVRAALDPVVFAAAFDAGRQLSLAEAFATVLAPVRSMPGT